jgi:hypothetical protein
MPTDPDMRFIRHVNGLIELCAEAAAIGGAEAVRALKIAETDALPPGRGVQPRNGAARLHRLRRLAEAWARRATVGLIGGIGSGAGWQGPNTKQRFASDPINPDVSNCPRCDGTGRYQRAPWDEALECAVCGGTGQLGSDGRGFPAKPT